MSDRLSGITVAVLAADGVEQVELTEPVRALEDAGARPEVVSLRTGSIQAMNHADKADQIPVDRALDEVSADDYDALLLPGGVMNPDHLRMEPRAVEFVRRFHDSGKPIAAICHAPWMLVEADAVAGRTLTSYPSLRTDVRNAGGTWVDEQVVVDAGLVTSRKPADLPAFCDRMLEEFAEGRHQRSPSPAAGRADGG